MTIDKNKCKQTFAAQYVKAKTLMEHIKVNRIKVMNSGIKVA